MTTGPLAEPSPAALPPGRASGFRQLSQRWPESNALAWTLGLALAWLWTWWRLSFEWRGSDQYQYGFAVPFLAAYLAKNSWDRHPPSGPFAPRRLEAFLRHGALACAWAAFLLGELIWQQDPSWRLSLWLMMFSVTLSTLLFLRRYFPFSTLRALAFPLAFAWLALPWPTALEGWIVRDFLRLLTGLTTDLFNAVGIPALQRGAVIELKNGMVGVETACSGVQSFQASLMATLFLGAFFYLPWRRRLALLFSGLFFALAANFLRIIILTALVSKNGSGAVDQYHDMVGGAATLLTFAGIFCLAAALARGVPPAPRAERKNRWTWRAAPGVFTEEHAPETSASRAWDGRVYLAEMVAVPILVWAWFHHFDSTRGPAQLEPQWQIDPRGAADQWRVQPVQLSGEEKSILRFSRGEAFKAWNDLGFSAYLYHFFWDPRARLSSAAFVHTPNVCLPSAGWAQVGPVVPTSFPLDGKPVAGTLYRFEQGPAEELVGQTIFPPPFFESGFPVLDRLAHFSLLWRAPRQRVHEIVLVYCWHRSGSAVPREILDGLFRDLFKEKSPTRGPNR